MFYVLLAQANGMGTWWMGILGAIVVALVVGVVGWALKHAIDTRLIRVEAKVDILPQQFAAVHKRVSEQEARLGRHSERLDGIAGRQDRLETRIERHLEQDGN